MLVPPPPPVPLISTLPPPEVIRPVLRTTTHELSNPPVPEELPPWPSIVTVPLAPAVIWSSFETNTPWLRTPLVDLPPVPVTDTLPPPAVIRAPASATKTPKLLNPPVPNVFPPWPTTSTVPLPP